MTAGINECCDNTAQGASPGSTAASHHRISEENNSAYTW